MAKCVAFHIALQGGAVLRHIVPLEHADYIRDRLYDCMMLERSGSTAFYELAHGIDGGEHNGFFAEHVVGFTTEPYEIPDPESDLELTLQDIHSFLSDPVRSAIRRARAWAKSHSHEYIGTEDMLVALAHESVVGDLIESRGATARSLNVKYQEMFASGPQMVNGVMRNTPRLDRALRRAVEVSASGGDPEVGELTLLHTILLEEESPAFMLLSEIVGRQQAIDIKNLSCP